MEEIDHKQCEHYLKEGMCALDKEQDKFNPNKYWCGLCMIEYGFPELCWKHVDKEKWIEETLKTINEEENNRK